MARVLVVDDDPSLLRALRVALRASGHEVTGAGDGEQGISQAALVNPDVIVLDLGLPDIDGLVALRQIRGWSDVPIIVLSATEAEDRKVAALDIGADDYVTKPFSMAELEARIRTAIRHHNARVAGSGPADVRVGPLELDRVHRQACLGGAPLELTAKEFDILSYLAQHAGQTCTHEMILGAVWGAGYAREVQYLHAYIHRLRLKLGDTGGALIHTAPGIGYSLNPPAGS